MNGEQFCRYVSLRLQWCTFTQWRIKTHCYLLQPYCSFADSSIAVLITLGWGKKFCSCVQAVLTIGHSVLEAVLHFSTSYYIAILWYIIWFCVMLQNCIVCLYKKVSTTCHRSLSGRRLRSFCSVHFRAGDQSQSGRSAGTQRYVHYSICSGRRPAGRAQWRRWAYWWGEGRGRRAERPETAAGLVPYRHAQRHRARHSVTTSSAN